jgi:hypothetical protein
VAIIFLEGKTPSPCNVKSIEFFIDAKTSWYVLNELYMHFLTRFPKASASTRWFLLHQTQLSKPLTHTSMVGSPVNGQSMIGHTERNLIVLVLFIEFNLKANILAFLSGYKTPSVSFAFHSIDSKVCLKGFLYAHRLN